MLAFHCERPTTGFDVITSKTDDEPGVFQLSLTAGKELEAMNRGMDYVFVLDVSGSMAFDGKLPLSRESLRSFIESLGPEDRFEVITFNIAPNTLFNEARPANEENMKQAVAFLESQRALGGTVLRPALDTAYRYQDPDRTLNVVDSFRRHDRAGRAQRAGAIDPAAAERFARVLHRRRQRGESSAARAVGERGGRPGGVHLAGRRF